MLTFREMWLTVYKRDSGEAMVALEARKPTVGDPEAYESVAGIRYLTFYFTRSEFTGLLTGRLGACNDIGHNVRRFGELYTFYDLEFARETRGVLRVPFVNIEIPHHVAKILLRAVQMMLTKCEPGGERREIKIAYDTRERWVRHYGQGTGKVVFDVHGQEFFDACKRDGGETFARCIDNLERIARNGTWRHTDVGRVCVSKDWDGFYFRIFDAKDKCTLNGGVINHGRDGAHDWSTHT